MDSSFIVPWTLHWTHAISWSYRLHLWSLTGDSFHGLLPETLFMVSRWRLFSWSLAGDSFGGLSPETLLVVSRRRLFLWSLAGDSFLYSLMDSFGGPQTLFVVSRQRLFSL